MGILLASLVVVVGAGAPPCAPPLPPDVEIAPGVRLVAAAPDPPTSQGNHLLDSLEGACFLPGPLQPQPLVRQEDSP